VVKPEPPAAAVEPPKPVAEAPKPSSETVEAPVLGEVLSPELRNQLSQELDSNLAEARSIISEITRRGTPSELNEPLARARAFVDQAEEFRRKDLRTAVSLSRRALVVLKDLDKGLR
jgi:hypothetical protein